MKTTVLVTGANGQLGQCIQSITSHHPALDFLFVDKQHLDITNIIQVSEFFKTHKIDWCINCAAYTAVDQAEIHQQQAYQINVLGAQNLAKVCQERHVKLIHISTDFVFEGVTNEPYKEDDITNPQGVYGATKQEAENDIQKLCTSYFIIRTSWLYSEFGNNFMKTMLRLASEREVLKVVNDQIGSPTYAVDLAKALLQIILKNSNNYGIYHYSNQGQVSWFEFAKAIFELGNCHIVLESISTKDYPTLATRPQYSVLDTSKISKEFDLEIPSWKNSLVNALSKV